MRENRFENTLAFMAAGTIGFSILVILITLITRAFGVLLPPTFMLIPFIGLPLGFLFVFTLLVRSMIRKARENK